MHDDTHADGDRIAFMVQRDLKLPRRCRPCRAKRREQQERRS
jgi:hypothetical protein